MSRLLKALAATGAKDTGYDIEQSLMLDQYNGYLHRTPSSAGNRKTWTFSAWVKRGPISTYQYILDSYGAGNNAGYFGIYFNNDDTLFIQGWTNTWLRTAAKYRDPSAWYHIVFALDTTQATAANRFKLYVNGSEISAWTSDDRSSSSQNDDYAVNDAVIQKLGVYYTTNSNYLNGHIAEVHLIDGTALAASHFGETDSDTGEWIPKEYDTSSAAYGTNGFYCKFASGAIGTDSSGEGHNLTTVSLDNGDVREDSPTNNFCKMNPLASAFPLFAGNNRVASDGNSKAAYGTFGVTSGKWYWEVYVRDWISGGGHFVGVGSGSDVVSGTSPYWYSAGFVGISTFNGDKYSNGLSPSTSYIGSAYADNDVVNVALDMDAGKLYIGKNGVYAGDANNDPADGEGNMIDGSYPLPSGHLMPVIGRGGSYDETYELNFGDNQTIDGLVTAYTNADGNGYGLFKYAPPSGFLALCSKNLATPTIAKGTDYFNTILYAGNGSDDHDITGFGFQPDFTWIASYPTTHWNRLVDSARGAGYALRSEDDDAQATETSNFKAFLSDGFRLGPPGNDYNASGQNYAAWSWLAGTAPTATNSAGVGATPTAGSVKIDGSNLGSALAGSIAATKLSANTTSGFSIVTYAGGSGTVAHGLGVTPKLVLQKKYDATGDWLSYTSAVDGTADAVRLNTTVGAVAADPATLATSTVFSTLIGGNNVIAYCFAEVEGYSKIGNYEGNNNDNGPFIYTGFSPAYVLIKYADNDDESWWILGNKLDPYNPTGYVGWANLTATFYDYGEMIDFTANGFKIRENNGGINGYSGGTYIYMAFAEAPFKYATAR